MLVFDADAGDVALFQFFDQPPQVIEIAIAGVAVQQDRDAGRIGHEFQHIDHLAPTGLIAVAHAELRRQRQAAAPDPLKAGLFRDPGGQAVMRLHNKFQPVGFEQGAQLFRFADLGHF